MVYGLLIAFYQKGNLSGVTPRVPKARRCAREAPPPLQLLIRPFKQYRFRFLYQVPEV